MICMCGKAKTSVKDVRPFEDGRTIWRRRVCKKCGKSFSTFEVDSTRFAVGGKIDWRSQGNTGK